VVDNSLVASMSARTFGCAFLLAATCVFVASPLSAQCVLPEAYRAKTIFIRNNAGGAPLENAADEELSKWGRFTPADDEASADIILVFSKNGVQNTEKSDNKKDGTCCETSYGASFSPGATVRAYLKGHAHGPGSLAFWQKRVRRHDAEGGREGLYRCVQEAASAIGANSS
jgi:hypothetical protein